MAGIVIRTGAWGALTGWVERLFSSVDPGSAGAGDIPVSSDYDAINSMSSMSRFPYVRACVQAVAGDLAGLPLVANRLLPDGSKERIPNHPVIQQLNNPGGRYTGRLLRKQLITDLKLTGNAYIWRPSQGGRPSALSPLIRLHPASVAPLASTSTGQVHAYKWTQNGMGRILSLDEITHIRDVSWQDTIEEAIGEGAIRCLHDALTAELHVGAQTARSAKRGRLEMLFSAKDENAVIGESTIAKITSKYEQATQSGKGAFFVGSPIEATPLSLSPREMEYAQLRELNTFAILAVFDVPPVRVGLPSANYGTSRQQMRSYWESLREYAEYVDDFLTQLAGEPGVRIEHDLSEVEALQVSYTERLTRVQQWVALGATPAAAAAYEGFVDAPVADKPIEAVQPRGPNSQPRVEEPQDKALAVEIARYLRGAAERYQVWTADGEVPDEAAILESVRLQTLLERAGHSRIAAGAAESIARINDEAVRQLIRITGAAVLTAARPFSAERAGELAKQITSAAVEAA